MSFSAAGADSYVLCELAGTIYAVRSDDISQIEMVGPITPVPNAPPFVEGVTSVRGRVAPVISLRAKFGFERIPTDIRSRLIVVRSEGRSVGLLVDGAREFASITEQNIQPPPVGLADLSSRYLRGMTHLGERLVLVLDIPELIRVSDTSDVITAEVISA